MRPFRFNFDKACQAVAYFLRRAHGHRMNYMKLVKLLYVADRECIAESGRTLTGSRFIAMERGPVVEDVYSLIRGQHVQSPEWSEYFKTDEYHLEMKLDPGMGELTRFTAAKLDEIYNRYRDKDEWDMVRLTHEFDEWKNNNPGSSSCPIPFDDVLKAIGRLGEKDSILEYARLEKATADACHHQTANFPSNTAS